jgi:hypothetical protein
MQVHDAFGSCAAVRAHARGSDALQRGTQYLVASLADRNMRTRAQSGPPRNGPEQQWARALLRMTDTQLQIYVQASADVAAVDLSTLGTYRGCRCWIQRPQSSQAA